MLPSAVLSLTFYTKKITMKKKISLVLLCCGLLTAGSLEAQQDKSKRPSPPATATQTLESGATITIEYSQPSVKGRTIGDNLEPKKDKVWRMGANEATVFDASKDVMVEGKALPAGRYSLFGLWGDDGFTLIFNSASKIWGTQYDQNKDKDVLRVNVKPRTTTTTQEQLVYSIDKTGLVTMLWGTMAVDFTVK